MIQKFSFICLLAFVGLVGCAQSRPRLRRPAAALPVIRFSAPYPATVLWALDGAAGLRGRDPGYRRWLFGDGGEPAWSADYQERRQTWSERQIGADGYYGPLEVCSYESHTLDAFLVCSQGLVPAQDRALFETAIRAADAILRARWPAQSSAMERLIGSLREQMVNPPAQRLLAVLREEAQLPPSLRLEFFVVLVAKPPGTHSFAQHEGRHLVHEVDPATQSTDLIPVVFHEIAHLAHYRSSARRAMEASFRGHGHDGIVAGNFWDEVLAAAYGNGLAASQINPRFSFPKQMYDDPTIDRLAHDLFLRWQGGEPVRLGADLGERLTQLVARARPPQGWSAREVFAQVAVFSDDRQAARRFTRYVRARSSSREVPIPDRLTRGDEVVPTSPRVVLALPQTLIARPALSAQLGLEETAVRAQLQDGAAALHLREDEDGSVLLLITARDAEGLGRASEAFGRADRVPAPGWSSLPLP